MHAYVEHASSQGIAIRRGRARAGAGLLAYEDWGDAAAPPILLIMGLGAQMVLWPDGFCRELVRAGLRVIRFDNRDVGLSDRFDGAEVAAGLASGRKGAAAGARPASPALWRLLLRAQLGWPTPVPYTLVDMADDTAMLLDALELPRAHVAGASMGGMIAQILAARHADRVASLALVFTSTNQPLLRPTAPDLLWKMLSGPGARAPLHEQKRHVKSMLRALGTREYPLPEADLDDIVETMTSRGLDAAGVRRQLMAVLGTGDLREYCARIRCPALVIHGEKDRMLPAPAGRAVARAIPGARLYLVPGMGHDLPPALWPMLVRLIADHCETSPIDAP